MAQVDNASVSTLSLDDAVPGSFDAFVAGCICPFFPPWPKVLTLQYRGRMFRADCPVHRHAVQAEVHRILGRSH